MKPIQLIECPRDAMQGLPYFIPTEKKILYLNTLLKCGFDILDFGSFVSPKAVPQMADTEMVIENLDLEHTNTKLLAIVANEKGIEKAVKYPQIKFLGFPLSLSETFQVRNTNSTCQKAIEILKKGLHEYKNPNQEWVIYLSMAFGNPYGDPYNIQMICEKIHQLNELGIKYVSLADTVGIAKPKDLEKTLTAVLENLGTLDNISLHLHTDRQTSKEKINIAYQAGCRKFEGALLGYGGCPFAQNNLIGNVDTETLIHCLNLESKINMTYFLQAQSIARELFTMNEDIN